MTTFEENASPPGPFMNGNARNGKKAMTSQEAPHSLDQPCAAANHYKFKPGAAQPALEKPRTLSCR